MDDHHLEETQDSEGDVGRLVVEELKHVDATLEAHGETSQEHPQAHHAHNSALIHQQLGELVEQGRGQGLHLCEL